MKRTQRRSPALVLPVMLLAFAACGSASGPSSQPTTKPAAASVGASSPAAKPETKPSGDQQAQWDQLLNAAKQEGTMSVFTPPGDVYRQVFDTFQKKFGITVEVLVGGGSPSLSKFDAERKGGQFLWDVIVHSPIVQFNGLKPMGALDPLRPALVLPEVLDTNQWQGGFEDGWADREKALTYSFVGALSFTAYVNHSVIPESQLNKLDQLWDPKWKGKIATDDPRIEGVAPQKTAAILQYKGEAKLRSLLADQQPVATQNRRQLVEWLVRGQYPIALAIAPALLSDFSGQGIDLKNVKPLDDGDPASAVISASAGAVAIFNRAPHPNAAKLFVNWLLSTDGQTTYAKLTAFNSRRKYVPIVSPETAASLNSNYHRAPGDIEENFQVYANAITIAKEVLQ